MLQAFLWTWGPWVYNKISSVLLKTQKVVRIVYNEFAVKKEWIFLKNTTIPINSETFADIEDINVRWRCEVNPPRFIEPGFSSVHKAKHLSYLGFIIKIKDKEIDLSNWINDVLYYGFEEPTIGEIFALWCCEQGVSYFHCFDSIQVEYITELGDVVRKRA
jgi:hypothetical protein